MYKIIKKSLNYSPFLTHAQELYTQLLSSSFIYKILVSDQRRNNPNPTRNDMKTAHKRNKERKKKDRLKSARARTPTHTHTHTHTHNKQTNKKLAN